VKRAAVTPLVRGVLVTALGWELIGRLHAFGSAWAPLSTVIAYAFTPANGALLLAAALRTGSEALAGLMIGGSAGFALASCAALVPRLARGLGTFASLINGIPIIAVAGVCALTVPRDGTPIVVASLAAGFMVFVASAAGLASTLAVQRDLFAVLGASRGATFARLLVPCALPTILDGVRSAAPSAVVGAIIGEWFSAERGLGPLLVAAMQNYAIAQLWAAALAGALLSIAAYALLGGLRAAVGSRFE
jgi:NitT/TauT family transport system permease protein